MIRLAAAVVTAAVLILGAGAPPAPVLLGAALASAWLWWRARAADGPR